MSPWVFYTLVSTITSAVFGLIGLLGLSLAGILSPLAAMILATMYLFMGLIIGWSIGAFTKRFTKEMKVKGFGLFQGRLGGLFVGGMAGFEIGNGIGAILGALIFYFLGLWIGPKASKEIANWIERNYDVLEVQTDQVAPKERGIFPSAYVLLFPFVFVIFGFLLKGIPIDVDFDPQYLPVARIVAVMFSLLTIGSLYWIKYLMVREMKIMETPAIDLLFIGTFFFRCSNDLRFRLVFDWRISVRIYHFRGSIRNCRDYLVSV